MVVYLYILNMNISYMVVTSYIYTLVIICP
jgi:hypothetical protein